MARHPLFYSFRCSGGRLATGEAPDTSIPLVLIKANVCRILEPRLAKDGFNVLNGGRVVYFPGTGRQKDFQLQFGAILKAAGLTQSN
jgi:hypothetical protein